MIKNIQKNIFLKNNKYNEPRYNAYISHLNPPRLLSTHTNIIPFMYPPGERTSSEKKKIKKYTKIKKNISHKRSKKLMLS